jgi:hypothetical protein
MVFMTQNNKGNYHGISMDYALYLYLLVIGFIALNWLLKL